MPSTPKPPAAPPSREPKRRRLGWTRRFGYFCGWLVLIAICLAGLIATLGWIGFKNVTPIANLARTKLAGDYPIEIGSITFPEKGLIEIRDVTIDLPEEGGRAGKIDRILLRYDPAKPLDAHARSLVIENPDFTLDDRLLGMFAPKDEDKDSAPMDLSWAQLDQLKIINGTINLDLQGIPKGTWHVDLEAEDIDLSSQGNLLSARPQRVTLRDILVEDPAGGDHPPLIKVAELTADLSLNKDFTSGAVASLKLTKPVVYFSPKLIAALQPESASANPSSQAEATPADENPMRWTIEQIILEDGFFSMSDFYDTPDVSFKHSGVFTDLSWSSDAGLAWPTRQETAITDLRLDAHALPADESNSPHLATFERIEIAGVPDVFFETGWIDKIVTRQPKIYVTEENIRRFLTEAPSAPSKLLMPPTKAATTPAASAAAAGEPYTIRVRELEIADAHVTIEAEGFMPGLPETTFKLNIRDADDQFAPDSDISYILSATELHVHEPGSTEAIVSGKEILSEFSAHEVQNEMRIESVTLSGIQVRIGEEIDKLIAKLNPPADDRLSIPPLAPGLDQNRGEPIPDPRLDPIFPPEDTSPEWMIGSLDLKATRFTLENFIPGLPYVPLVLETRLEEVPLSGRSRGEERIQRIELRKLEIASTANSLIPVAKLNSIWIHFTIPGLIRNEIEKIEIVNPEIYLGEHLFWYVDYYRKLAEADGAAKVAAITPAIVEVKKAAPAATDGKGKGKIAVVEDALKNTEISGWKLKMIEASSGKLIVAPKGYPIGILPFPFTAKTNLAEGKIELDLKVPPGDYVFEQLKLELRGLNGQAFFNYPIRSENNNFVQTFRVPELRFQQYEADDVYLSVTYDENGIYGKLGGEAYSGYAEGEFNIYIGETYKWDAWVAGTKLDLQPITDILSPENVKVSGILDAKIIANGEGFIPAKVTGEMETSGKCHMHITKLDDVLESLPEPQVPQLKGRVDILDAFIEPITTGLQAAISKAGIEAFRHYDFTSGAVKLGLDGRDGSASMLLDGPDGKRDLLFHFFDKRELAGPVRKP
ncbi:MAG: hypothetical protein ACI9UA_005701 [Pseudoalteromonas tetraodonis]|jgi:hypothetical protein